MGYLIIGTLLLYFAAWKYSSDPYAHLGDLMRIIAIMAATIVSLFAWLIWALL